MKEHLAGKRVANDEDLKNSVGGYKLRQVPHNVKSDTNKSSTSHDKEHDAIKSLTWHDNEHDTSKSSTSHDI